MAITPKKRFGQNFLVEEKVVADLVAAADLSANDTVIEVGAGTGVLTKKLAERAGKVVAFEIDRDLIPVLKKNLQGFDNVEIINQDFLKAISYQLPAASYPLVGSIPYQMTSPLIHKLLKLDPKPSLVVLLIQKEVAEKITARPPRATYLSNIVRLLGEVEILRKVPKTAFWPVPEVDGAITKLKVQGSSASGDSSNLKFKVKDVEDFQEFLHQGFQQPRKMLRGKLDSAVLEKAGIDPTSRAQKLSFNDWLRLYRILPTR